MNVITVLRGNEELDITEDKKELFKKRGYKVIDKSTGKVLEEAANLSIEGLSSEVVKLQKDVEKIVAERDELRAERDALLKKLGAEKPSTRKKKSE
jgi:regulator of replication initiation timing